MPVAIQAAIPLLLLVEAMEQAGTMAWLAVTTNANL